MKPGIIDWLGRAAMLVLAGMVTLAIIGSIAAIPSESLESRMGIESRERDTIVEEARPEAPERRPEANSSAPSDTEAAVEPPSPLPPDEAEPARWLEAITYALLALVGIAALATLILWRGLRERRRIADAVEELAARA